MRHLLLFNAFCRPFFCREDQIPTEFNDDGEPIHVEEEDSKEGIKKDDLQTFVFSATLSKDLQRNLKKRSRSKGSKKHYKRNEAPASTLGISLFNPFVNNVLMGYS